MQNRDLQASSNFIASISCKGLSVAKLKKMVSLCTELSEAQKSYNDVRKKIFESYDVTKDEQLVNHPKLEEIEKKVTELDNEEVIITNGNFLTEEETIAAIKSADGNVSVLMIIGSILEEKTTETEVTE